MVHKQAYHRRTIRAVSPFERKETHHNKKISADMDACLNCAETKCKGDCEEARKIRRISNEKRE